MLYKKYHRSYISQFKKGVKIKLESDKLEGEILTGPSIEEDWRDIFIRVEFLSDDRYRYWRELTLIYASGRLIKDINVIQEIS